MERKKLAIPVNVVEQSDFIAGFGNKELTISGIALVMVAIGVISVLIADGNLVASLGIGFGILALVITVIKRDRFDESIIDKVRFVKIYYKAQKRYKYEYYNIYEGGQHG